MAASVLSFIHRILLMHLLSLPHLITITNTIIHSPHPLPPPLPHPLHPLQHYPYTLPFLILPPFVSFYVTSTVPTCLSHVNTPLLRPVIPPSRSTLTPLLRALHLFHRTEQCLGTPCGQARREKQLLGGQEQGLLK